MSKLNWPTAFVIVAIIFAGAFVYNKPIDAAASTGGGMIAASGYKNAVWQLKAGKVRICSAEYKGDEPWIMFCSRWSYD